MESEAGRIDFLTRCGVGALVVALAIVMMGSPAQGSSSLSAPTQQVFDGPNGEVNAIAVGPDGTAYLGGSFTAWGPQTGGGAVLDPTSATVSRSFPPVQGRVFAAAGDGAGGWYIGGNFQAVAGVSRRHLAHILPNGQLDLAWNPRPNSNVSRIGVSPDGSVVYVSGQFTQMCGAGSSCGSTQTRNYLAAINSDGSLAAWNPSPDADVLGMDVSPDGTTVYVGGNFSKMCVGTSSCTSGEQSRIRLAAVTSAGDLLPWNPAPSDGRSGTWVRSVAVSPDGTTVYVGGNFSKVDGLSRSRIAAVTNGAVSSFDPQVTGGYPDVQALAVSPDGQTVYLGGDFTAIGGQSRGYAGAVDATTGAATAWIPNPGSKVWGMTVLDDTVYLAGEFTSVCGAGSSCGASQTRRYLAAFGSDGILASWNPNVNNTGWEVAASTTAIYAGGYFTTFSSTPRSRLAAVNSAGELTPWSPEANSSVLALEVHGSTVIAGGVFTTINGLSRARLAAIDASDGTQVDPWAPNANDWVRSMTIVDDSLYVAGDFSSIAGASRASAAAFDLAGQSGPALAAWNPGFDGPVTDLAATASYVYAAGDFTTVQGQSRTGFAQVSAAGSGTPTSWDPLISSWGTATAHAVATSGSDVYIGGDFQQVGSDWREYSAAFSGGSSFVNAWNPGFNWVVYDLAISGTTVYAVGEFTTVAGQTRNYVAGIDANGSPTSFNPVANDTVRTLEVSEETAYLAGSFTSLERTANGATYSPHFAMTWILEPQAALTVTGAPASLEYDDSAVLATSGGTGAGALTFSAGASTGCSVSGSTLTAIAGSGTCVVTATKTSDGTYASATSPPVTVTIAKAQQSALTLQSPVVAEAGQQYALTTTGGSGGGAVTYSTGSSTGCSVSASTLLAAVTGGTCVVTATKAGGADYLSTTSQAVTVTVTGTVPTPDRASPPLFVEAIAGDASAVVTWATPESSGSYPVSTYQVVASPGGRSCLASAPVTSCAVTGLVNGTAYTASVRALSGAGWGAWSDASAAFTPEAPVRPAIVITGTRGEVTTRSGRVVTGVVVRGVATGMEPGSVLRPWMSLNGDAAFEGSARIPVGEAGEITWARATRKAVTVYVAAADGVRSNSVRIPSA